MMTKRISFTRNVRQRRKAITPTAMAKPHALEPLYAQNVTVLVMANNWSDTQPNTMMEKSYNSVHVCVSVCTSVHVHIHNM